MTPWKGRLTVLLMAFVLLYIADCAYMWAAQNRYIFVPGRVWQTTPERMGMRYMDVHIPVGSEGEELDAWWVPSDLANSPNIIYFHGNDRNISNNLEQTQRLHSLGYNVLLADYRGFGKSSGNMPDEAKVYEDAQAVWHYMIKLRNPGKIFIYGHSLGGAIAINLAIYHPEAAGLIVESTFTSMLAMGKLTYGYLPVDWLLNQRFDSLQKVARLRLPVLYIHGTWDQRVPAVMSQQLYAATPFPKQLLLIEGGEHNNSSAIGWIEYRHALSAFVKQCAR
jgi:hypothetical protein